VKRGQARPRIKTEHNEEEVDFFKVEMDGHKQ
jgi:hypothetical protein